MEEHLQVWKYFQIVPDGVLIFRSRRKFNFPTSEVQWKGVMEGIKHVFSS
jgi:hypothetical protein